MSYTWSSKGLDDGVFAVKAEITRLQDILNAKTGKIAEVTPYPIYALCFQRHFKDVGKPPYSSYGSNENTPERALAEGAKVYEESKLLVEVNRAICAENRRIVNHLIAEIANAGFPRQVQKKVVFRGKTKTESEMAGWTKLEYHTSTNDMWESCERLYKEFVEKCSKWRQEIDQAKRTEEHAKAQIKAKSDLEVKRITLCVKYGVDPVDSDRSDVRDAILDKNKYLRLAHYLQLNRGDWNDGPSYAESGMSGFTVETVQDQEIVDDIQPMIDEWQGDGRCFRDTTWNYSALFALAPADLLEDYNSLGTDDY